MDGSIYGVELNPLNDAVSLRSEPKDGLTARLALTEEHLRDAWGIRHDAYAAQGLIKPRSDGLLADESDFWPSVNVIVIYRDGVPVATTRVCLYEPQGGIKGADYVPAMAVYPDEVRQLYETVPANGRHARVVEIARLARHPDIGADSEPVFGLLRMACYMLLHMDADAAISAVQKHHIPFYRRLGVESVTEPRRHPKFDAEVALLACVRKPEGHLRDSLKILGLVSKSDSSYYDFVSGERVPVFGTGQAPAEVTGFMGGRFERAQGTRRMPMPVSVSSREHRHEIAMAA